MHTNRNAGLSTITWLIIIGFILIIGSLIISNLLANQTATTTRSNTEVETQVDANGNNVRVQQGASNSGTGAMDINVQQGQDGSGSMVDLNFGGDGGSRINVSDGENTVNISWGGLFDSLFGSGEN